MDRVGLNLSVDRAERATIRRKAADCGMSMAQFVVHACGVYEAPEERMADLERRIERLEGIAGLDN